MTKAIEQVTHKVSEESLKEITQWRKELIEGSLQAILTPH